ncbi:GTP pyrophosphokinase [Lentilactobacillus hilgardii]|uniref:RelA/SpoT domain protein n=1 Tax=Lentilactobacillus hilgardii (strain ATCC 8290 / DSM 20176 / CCUG 30140 / JCM 1155 / KCTC 3500 / NBRC 15886 / NCIMB 8040 / NRRL B-1843 / 9) TaxID=1423757 RepID=C0XKI0_LENH9|nr:GTP pyrophosphokinase family protein [Lentilactobacillus hilgardii]EEI19943.1 RelA/SpoT domain protein [Lentilactobacillus buchneri ATCC 11577]EEI24083.1 RelA/SpoT domain protein [Lentilactobacillus hilgardii DSM 20176 = ATCC 8290]KRK58012.1 GTP pyrophosphokinase [Lentilactobacillus hilgardii DSM 20176 = ATCC 8290]MCP9332860.1 GTP pyrophosphokinase family protein [Lentilactobacillus hilgardii]MCP9349469.1 GTP pyrophosphokinase family protein [Lentilactobacillus hilgardii]
MVEDWDNFLIPYKQAVDELKVKLRGIRAQFLKLDGRSPIEFVTGRVKPVDSIKEKMVRRHISEDRLEEDMEDIAGLRIMCQFVEDIYQVVDLLRKRTDINILEERDYVHNKKPSGYRSYHIIFEYPVQMLNGEKVILAEIQVRTLAMNFWATVEHSLNYKYKGEFPDDLKVRLERSAEAAFKLDEEMSEIRGELQETKGDSSSNDVRKSSDENSDI